MNIIIVNKKTFTIKTDENSDVSTNVNRIFLSLEDRANWLRNHTVRNEPMVFGCGNKGFLILYKNVLYGIGKNCDNRFSDEPEDTMYSEPHLIAKDVIHAVGTRLCTIFITCDGRVHWLGKKIQNSETHKNSERLCELKDIREVYIISNKYCKYCFIDKDKKLFVFELKKFPTDTKINEGNYEKRQYSFEAVLLTEKEKDVLTGKKDSIDYISLSETKSNDNNDVKKIIHSDPAISNIKYQMELNKNGTVAIRISRKFFSRYKVLEEYSNIVDIAFLPLGLSKKGTFLLVEKNGVFHYGTLEIDPYTYVERDYDYDYWGNYLIT